MCRRQLHRKLRTLAWPPSRQWMDTSSGKRSSWDGSTNKCPDCSGGHKGCERNSRTGGSPPGKGGGAAPVIKKREDPEAAQNGGALWDILTFKHYPGPTTPSA